jgi:hypothetical protein
MTISTDIFLSPDKRRPLEFSVNAPPRWLELALAVDHTVIRFHGRERVQQYILALMNIVSTTSMHTQRYSLTIHVWAREEATSEPPCKHRILAAVMNVLSVTRLSQKLLYVLAFTKSVKYSRKAAP